MTEDEMVGWHQRGLASMLWFMGLQRVGHD